MMAETNQDVPPPSIRWIAWLLHPGAGVPERLHGVLRARMVSGVTAILMGVVNSLLVSTVALLMQGGAIFAGFIAADLTIGAVRACSIRSAERAMARGDGPSLNLYLITGILWSALQGIIGFAAMQSGKTALEIVSTATVFGVVGPVCARNYPAPRFTLLLICLINLPWVLSCILSSNHWLLVTAAQTPVYLVGMYKVVSIYQGLAVESLQAALESLDRATHDHLTGLLNRRGYEEAHRAYASAHALNLSVLALDLDGFKQVNDTMGHHVGDALLQAVAGRLATRVRASDRIVRLGGDEFLMLLDRMSFAEAEKLARRLVEDIGNAPYRIDGAPLVRVGVSIGIACGPEDGDSVEQLHRRADLALYDAKAAGRGCYRRYRVAMDEKV